jgi:hypothetical protein
MTLNVFDSDAQCGWVRNWDSAGPNPNSDLTPSGILTWNSTDIKTIVGRIDKLDAHTFGGQPIKYRYWKIHDVDFNVTSSNQSGDFGEVWLTSLNFYHESKILFNGVASDNSCISEKVNGAIQALTSTIAPSLWTPQSLYAPYSSSLGNLLDGNAFTSARFAINPSLHDLEIIADFGEDNKYAITSITQGSINRAGFTMRGFSVSASNDGVNWDYLCTFSGIPDHAEPKDPYVPNPSEQYYVEGPHCVVVRRDTTPAVFPEGPQDKIMEDVPPSLTHVAYFDLEEIITTAGDNAINLNALSIYADGELYKDGYQHYIGRNVDNLVTRADKSAQAIGSSVSRFNVSRNQDNTWNVGAVYPNAATATNVRFYFDRLNPQNVTSLQIKSDLEVSSLRFKGYNVEGTLIKDISFDSDFLADNIVNRGTDGNFSDHFILLKTATGQSVFPGDAARMWPGDSATPVEGGGGDPLWVFDTTLRTSDFTASSNVYYLVSTSPEVQLEITLPDEPSDGDVVLARDVSGNGAILFVVDSDPGSPGIEGSNTEGEASISESQPKVGLVYSSSENSWYVFLGSMSSLS